MNASTPAQAGSPTDAAPPATTPWAQQSVEAESRATRRARRIVEGLPAWEPLPPGEITVNRPRQQ
jgi:hypothetical protein